MWYSFPTWETCYRRAFNDSMISSCSGKRPTSAFENTCVPSATTINTPPSPLMSSGATPSSFSNVSAKLTALGKWLHFTQYSMVTFMDFLLGLRHTLSNRSALYRFSTLL